MFKVKKISALEILDSRGHPTVAATVELANRIKATAMVPAGASTGRHEAHELRDKTKRYQGLGVSKAVKNIEQDINQHFSGKSWKDQIDFDYQLCVLDGSAQKQRLGANAILAVSLAFARVCSYSQGKTLFEFLRQSFGFPPIKTLPFPTFNILNGGRHADNGLSVQEFMIVPQQKKFHKRLQAGAEIYHHLKKILIRNKLATGLGDEGGFAPRLKNSQQVFSLLKKAITSAGYNYGLDVFLAVDVAASEFYKNGYYFFEGKNRKAEQMVNIYQKWLKKYPLISIEDGLAQDDWQAWEKMTNLLRKQTLLVGDDLFVTNYERLQRGIDNQVANALLVKPNQIGTVSETVSAVKLAQKNGYEIIVSHRSGETPDDFIADLAVAVGAKYIKAGAPARSERLAKYNRLLKIEKNYLL